MRWLLAVAWLVGVASPAAPSAWAAVVASREDLLAILGPTAQTEDFERFQAQRGTAYGLARRLDSTTVTHTQGPGLIRPGIAFDFIDFGVGGNLQWNGAGVIGASSRTIQTTGPGDLLVDFSVPTRAFGADLFSSKIDGTTTAAVDVYAPDDRTLLATLNDLRLTWPGPTFVGYESPGGIGSVVMRPVTSYFIPVDNLTFNVVPEPACAPAAAFAAGLLLARRRRWRE
jgi:hypothetical protein